MNRLERQFKDAFDTQYQKFRHVPTYKELAQVAASIALELAEKAYYTGWSEGYNDGVNGDQRGDFNKFKQEVL
jgi:hypothetical protein